MRGYDDDNDMRSQEGLLLLVAKTGSICSAEIEACVYMIGEGVKSG
jgi:hypothetical protein